MKTKKTMVVDPSCTFLPKGQCDRPNREPGACKKCRKYDTKDEKPVARRDRAAIYKEALYEVNAVLDGKSELTTAERMIANIVSDALRVN